MPPGPFGPAPFGPAPFGPAAFGPQPFGPAAFGSYPFGPHAAIAEGSIAPDSPLLATGQPPSALVFAHAGQEPPHGVVQDSDWLQPNTRSQTAQPTLLVRATAANNAKTVRVMRVSFLSALDGEIVSPVRRYGNSPSIRPDLGSRSRSEPAGTVARQALLRRGWQSCLSTQLGLSASNSGESNNSLDPSEQAECLQTAARRTGGRMRYCMQRESGRSHVVGNSEPPEC